MNGFFFGLPWNLSALGALVVLVTGIISGVDLWIALERGAVAFIVFWIVGLIGRQAFCSTETHIESSVKPARTASSDHKQAE
jgi:hypothetical protein